MSDVIVVGGGLFGSIAAQALRKAGMDVELIDNEQPRAGSRAAGCLMRPAWLQRMGREGQKLAFDTLGCLYPLHEVPLHLGPATVTATWIDPDEVMRSPRRLATVKEVYQGRVVLEDGEVLEAPKVIVAAGVWTRTLVPGLPVTGKVGVSLRLDKPVTQNRISVWAPYKQLVRFSHGGFHWAGDGTAILDRNWTEGRRAASIARITDFAGPGIAREGVRPYVDTPTPAALEQVGSGVWSLTGGGKNGTAAAGWAAGKLLQALT